MKKTTVRLAFCLGDPSQGDHVGGRGLVEVGGQLGPHFIKLCQDQAGVYRVQPQPFALDVSACCDSNVQEGYGRIFADHLLQVPMANGLGAGWVGVVVPKTFDVSCCYFLWRHFSLLLVTTPAFLPMLVVLPATERAPVYLCQ